jgi:hypothetical protein
MNSNIEKADLVFGKDCVIVKWNVKDIGNGNIMIYKKDDKIYIDTENYGKEFVKYILDFVVDKTILKD